ncbi:hypothetical protein KGQ20_39290 [Catenulispora sp. NF23]|uniref:hypothetical protein n=1 Tax=Catenulispora pinistramenti TaxID=2705254 RepID=UPI001BABF3B7|nr:hypothetical protein [Catenulispora pinistramenti]MBS2538809.1 hypothetical protein [Catenulispora pinistramenti]
MLVQLGVLAAAAGLTAGCALPSGASSSGGSGTAGGVAGGGVGGGGGEDTCVIGFDPEGRGVSAGHGLVTATATVNCSQPTQIHVVVTLTYDGGNGMREVAKGEFDGVTIDTSVATRPANCYEGRYRATYTATARANGEVKNQSKVSDVTTLGAGDCRA